MIDKMVIDANLIEGIKIGGCIGFAVGVFLSFIFWSLVIYVRARKRDYD